MVFYALFFLLDIGSRVFQQQRAESREQRGELREKGKNERNEIETEILHAKYERKANFLF